jgi:two-component system, cell cycle response regulator
MTAPDPIDTSLATPVAHRSASGLSACLVHIYPPGPDAGCRYPLAERPLLIGRADDRDVRIEDPSVSRRHARIAPAADGGHAVEDLGSTNGTQVNNEPVGEPRTLRDGDYVRVGNRLYRYLAGGNLEAEYHEEIYRLAVRDGLTGLPNRRALDEFLAREAARAHRHARPLSVVLFDVDRFKSVNDTRGHLCGDVVLREVGAILAAAARAEDQCARYGGEEFALVMVEADHAGALAAAERVRAAVEGHRFQFEGQELAVTISAGVATTCGGAPVRPIELLNAADGRLYAAKREGRNRVVGASPNDADLFDTVVAEESAAITTKK